MASALLDLVLLEDAFDDGGLFELAGERRGVRVVAAQQVTLTSLAPGMVRFAHCATLSSRAPRSTSRA